jgi:hypothetical protein
MDDFAVDTSPHPPPAVGDVSASPSSTLFSTVSIASSPSPLPSPFTHPFLPPSLQALVEYLSGNSIWMWTEELEDVYHLFSGWEVVAETYNAYARAVKGVKIKRSEVGMEVKELRVRLLWIRDNIAGSYSLLPPFFAAGFF